MKIYHGTGIGEFKDIEESGFIQEDSYFGDLDIAIEYAESHGDGVVLSTTLIKDNFKANIMLNNAEYEAGDTDVILDEDDLEQSLSLYESVVSSSPVYDYETMSLDQAKSKLFSLNNPTINDSTTKEKQNKKRSRNRP